MAAASVVADQPVSTSTGSQFGSVSESRTAGGNQSNLTLLLGLTVLGAFGIAVLYRRLNRRPHSPDYVPMTLGTYFFRK